MTTVLYPVRSNATVNFLQSLAQNVATPMNNIELPPAINGRRALIRAISLIAKENFGPELSFFSNAAGFTTDPTTDLFVSRWGFAALNGTQLAAAGLWRYYIDGLAIPYVDLDAAASVRGSLHVVLQNTDGTVTKSANAAGAIQLTCWLEPMQAW